jgi:hemerythrin-like domain-containing protein
MEMLTTPESNSRQANNPAMAPGLAWFVQDHDTLLPALEALKLCVAHQQVPSKALLLHVQDHMAEHFGLEETVLFPMVPFAPSAVMLVAEHDALWQLWHAMHQACAGLNANWPQTVDAFCQRMQAHMHEENACLLPSCERDMTASDKARLWRALEQAQLSTVTRWVERPALSYGVQLLANPIGPLTKPSYTITPHCRAEWVTLPGGPGLRSHCSPHAQQITVVSGQVQVVTPTWQGTLTAGQPNCLHLDPMVPLAVTASAQTSVCLVLKLPVVYPALQGHRA